MLHDPGSHEPLVDRGWDAAAAEDAIRTIARDADDALRDGDWWPLHPLDDDGAMPDALHGIYFGAAGVLWALDHLRREGAVEFDQDFRGLLPRLLDRKSTRLNSSHVKRSRMPSSA